MLLWYLALSFEKEKNNTLLDTFKILMEISTQILGLRIFFRTFLKHTHHMLITQFTTVF